MATLAYKTKSSYLICTRSVFQEIKRKVENKLLCEYVTEKSRWVILISDKMLFKAKSTNEDIDNIFKV